MNISSHPSSTALTDFMSGDLPAGETRMVVRHLLKGCAECRRITRRLWPVTGEPHPPVELDFEVQIDRLRARSAGVAEEREQASVLLDQLEAHPQNRRVLLVTNSRRFHSWFLAELITAKVAKLMFTEPALALDYAQLAVAVAERLPTERYGQALVKDMRARALGTLGNVLRINSDLVAAGEALQQAGEVLESGTGDPLEEVRLLGWRANYLKARREIKASVRLYDRAIGLCRRIADIHQMGRMMADKGIALCTAGDFGGAIRATEEALRHIDGERDPRAMLAAKHNLSLYLHRSGDIERAMTLLQEILPLYAEQNEPMVLMRLRWLEGRLAQTQREFRRAEEAFREVQQGFIERQIPFDAAAVSFDLATILLEENRFDELGKLASQILAVFNSLGIARETIAALELFQRAVEAQNISVSWISELAAYFERAQAKPDLPFKPKL